MNGNFHIPTNLIMGTDCVTGDAKRMSFGKKALIVTGKSSARKNGSLDDVIKALESNGQKYEIFDKVMSNPTIDCVYAGADAAKRCGADFVIGIGGGSPMDSAKAIAVLAKCDIPRGSLFLGGFINDTLPTVMVPTTAGTGSEVTQYTILTNDELQTKTTMSSPLMFPSLAYLDGKYLEKLPKNVAVNTVTDALSHSVEGYLSRRANPITDALAREGMRLIADNLDKLSDYPPEREALDAFLYASTLGGMVIAHTGTTAVHSMGYSLTYFRHIEHGRANGLLLGEFLKYVRPFAPERISQILEAMRFKSTDEFSEMLDSLLGKKEKLTVEEAEKYSALAVKAKNIPNCVAVPDIEDIKEIYVKSFGI